MSRLTSEPQTLAVPPRSCAEADSLRFASHRLLRLKSSNHVVVLADRSNGWCVVEDSAYVRLRDLLHSGVSPSKLSDASIAVLEKLWNAGLILADGAAHPDTTRRRESVPSSLLLKLTGACNFDCTYCYDYDPKRFKVRLDYDRAVEVISSLLARRDTLGLVFHGGEPLLRFELLKQIVATAIKLAGETKRLHFAIQTNGALLDAEKIRYLEELGFSVGISLDGNSEETNHLRPDHGGATAFSHVERLFSRFGKFLEERCGFLAVASRTSAPALPQFALWLQEKNISSLSVTFLDLVGRGKEVPAEKLSPQESVALYAELVQLVREGRIKQLALRSLLSRIDNLFTFQPRDFCHKGPCAASDEFLVLDAEGALRSCDCIYHPYFMLASRSQPVTAAFAHPARDAIVERHLWLRDQGSECKQCPLFGLCGGTCVAKAVAVNGVPASVDPIECALSRYLYPELLEEFAADGEKPLFDYFERHRQQMPSAL